MLPLISIVIPAFIRSRAQAELLKETLQSVHSQTVENFECIVVDDGSPLDVRELAGAFPHTAVVSQKNAGSAMARNAGIGVSTGEYFVFLDADDHLLPTGLETLLAALHADADCGFVVGGRAEMTYEGGAVPWGVPQSPRETQLYLTLLGFGWYIIPPSSVMFRRQVVEAIGPWRDPWGADDLDYYLRAARLYRARCFDEPAVTRYRRYPASSSRDGARMLHSMRAVYARQWPFVQGDPAGEAAFHRGRERLTEIFRDCLAENLRDDLRAGDTRRVVARAALLARESPRRLFAEVTRALSRAELRDQPA
jgi:glycosyltransferase involved in cell wall biosynthesis